MARSGATAGSAGPGRADGSSGRVAGNAGLAGHLAPFLVGGARSGEGGMALCTGGRAPSTPDTRPSDRGGLDMRAGLAFMSC